MVGVRGQPTLAPPMMPSGIPRVKEAKLLMWALLHCCATLGK